MSALAAIGRAVLWTGIAAASAATSLAVHLSTHLGHDAARDGLETALSSRIRGTVRIEEVTRLGTTLEMRGFTVTAPSGERVVATDRMSGTLRPLESLRRGALVMYPCVMEGGEIRLTRGPRDQVDLVYAMEVPDDRAMIEMQMRDIRILHQRMILDLPGTPGAIEMDDIYGLADMTIGHQFVWREDNVHGYVNLPIVHIGFERMQARLRSDDATPLVARMVLDLEIADPSMEIRYHDPQIVGLEGGGGTGIELGVDVPDERHIATSRRGQPRE